MSYELQFLPSALKEWRKLGTPVRQQFKKKLAERLISPHVPADRLHGLEHHYKIKLRSAGYRLVYEVHEASVTVTVIAVGKRYKGTVYKTAQNRKGSQ
ncbi:type II toxin-antitoxin system RelE family toxin [Salibaculum griseiflavum]|uniref:Type II toxin-antitoxin system mRNA interferase toxin, RelE/StbE family n=1 Tax=Salibaculum griseiflavum TaxID=1914409 RepID=A0A2V1P0R4_9RHOB|nr:type II toxin-antitoxin system RelE/ParE family toxin [Salibaculum griseiflavum]PWG16143.1 type II toxin-antitoxin system mRNA interferase toxin, RelE/StbE family [Salibaculum griseiflavum]